MRNIKSIVSAHNRKILTEELEENQRKCNCPRNTTCPMNGNCLAKNTMYSGKITSDLPNYGATEYVGISEPEWKKRLGNHTISFNNRDYAKCEIAKEVWRIKDQGGSFNINWSIIGYAPPYNPTSKKCNLCLSEALYINEHAEELLNSRRELVKKCRHQNKFWLNQKDLTDVT